MKNILILGANSDLASAFIAEHYTDYDAIIAHYHNNKPPFWENFGDKITAIQGDFASADETLEFVAKIQKYDITHIIHIPAPRFEYLHFKKTVWEKFQQGYDIQIRSIYEILKSVLPKMSALKYGKIVFVLTSCVLNEPPKFLCDYVVNKYALLGLMKALAQEFATKHININAVSPSMMETKFLEKVPELMVEQSVLKAPMGRNARVSDTISAIKFLLSDEAEYITGQNLAITGGNTV